MITSERKPTSLNDVNCSVVCRTLLKRVSLGNAGDRDSYATRALFQACIAFVWLNEHALLRPVLSNLLALSCAGIVFALLMQTLRDEKRPASLCILPRSLHPPGSGHATIYCSASFRSNYDRMHADSARAEQIVEFKCGAPFPAVFVHHMCPPRSVRGFYQDGASVVVPKNGFRRHFVPTIVIPLIPSCLKLALRLMTVLAMASEDVKGVSSVARSPVRMEVPAFVCVGPERQERARVSR